MKSQERDVKEITYKLLTYIEALFIFTGKCEISFSTLVLWMVSLITMTDPFCDVSQIFPLEQNMRILGLKIEEIISKNFSRKRLQCPKQY